MRFLVVVAVVLLSPWVWSSDVDGATVSVDSVLLDTQEMPGFVPLHWDSEEGRLYADIKNIEGPFIYYNGLSHGLGSNDLGLDRGRLGDTFLVEYRKVGKKVFLAALNTKYTARSDDAQERRAVAEPSCVIWAACVLGGARIRGGRGVRDDDHPWRVDDPVTVIVEAVIQGHLEGLIPLRVLGELLACADLARPLPLLAIARGAQGLSADPFIAAARLQAKALISRVCEAITVVVHTITDFGCTGPSKWLRVVTVVHVVGVEAVEDRVPNDSIDIATIGRQEGHSI